MRLIAGRECECRLEAQNPRKRAYASSRIGMDAQAWMTWMPAATNGAMASGVASTPVIRVLIWAIEQTRAGFTTPILLESMTAIMLRACAAMLRKVSASSYSMVVM